MKYSPEFLKTLRGMSVINSITKDKLKNIYDDLYDNQTELPSAETCLWENLDYEHNIWNTQCGLMWTLEEGAPEENDMNYCPKCGNKLIQFHRMSDI